MSIGTNYPNPLQRRLERVRSGFLPFVAMFEVASYFGEDQLDRFVIAGRLQLGQDFFGFGVFEDHDLFAMPCDKDFPVFLDPIREYFFVESIAFVDSCHNSS